MPNFLNKTVGGSLKIIFGVLIASLIIFIIQNWSLLNEPVTLKFIGSAVFPLWAWFSFLFLAGCVTWFLLGFKSKRSLKKSLNKTELELSILKKELEKLRNSSHTDEVKSVSSITPPMSPIK